MPDVLTPEYLQARHVGEDLELADLVEVIDAEEDYLEHRLGGPLAGDWTQTFHGSGLGSLWLSRRLASVTTITDAGVTVDPALYVLDGQRIVGSYGAAYWIGPVVVTGPLADENVVRAVLVDLVRLRLSDTGHDAVSAGGQSRSDTMTSEERRDEIIRALLPGRGIA